MKKAIIFDLDGVLVHTDNYHFLAWKKLADELGIYFDESINNRCRGVSRMDSLEIVLEQSSTVYTAEQKLKLAEQKNNTYQQFLQKMSPADVSEDVVFTLQQLKKRGVLLAVGSSSKNAKLILQQVGLLDQFDAVSDGTMICFSKPHPEVFLKAAELLNLDANDCAVVEDAVAGIQAGLSAGMQTFAIGDAAKCNVAHHNLSKLSDLLLF